MINKNISIATIITCHNRKEKTLTCLENLMNQEAVGGIDLKVYLVDDGSTDGTGDMVKQSFPHVNMLQGDGTLYWNGGMRFACFPLINRWHQQAFHRQSHSRRWPAPTS